MLFVKDDIKAFVDRSVGSGYPRKFECRTRRNGCRAGGSRMRQLAAGLFGIGILGFVTQNRRAGQPEAGDSTAPDLGPWRSRLWGVGPYRRARGPGDVAKNKVTNSKTPQWACMCRAGLLEGPRLARNEMNWACRVVLAVSPSHAQWPPTRQGTGKVQARSQKTRSGNRNKERPRFVWECVPAPRTLWPRHPMRGPPPTRRR